MCYLLKIPFVAYVPCAGFDEKWPAESRKAYWEILKRAETIIEVSALAYHPALMQRRNEYMVDNSDLLLAVWDGSDGGTANCVGYAKIVGRKIERINPKELTC